MNKFKPGIYFGLPERQYHADPALGSTDVRALLRSVGDYWWRSWMNPRKPKDGDDTTPARLRGRAIHKVVLEGNEAFDLLYSRRADDDEGAMPGDKSVLTKSEKKRAAAEGRDLLLGNDYDRALITGAMIRKNPELKTAFEGGVPEVSVFWDHRAPVEGKLESIDVPCKARFDYLRPRGIADLKSITNMRGMDFVQACRNAIANYRYEIQAAHYLEGRAMFRRLFEAGAVYDVSESIITKTEDAYKSGRHAFAARVADAKEFAFVWVFFQADEAPITWAANLSPGNPIVDIANRQRDIAFRRYVEWMETFGPDEQWLLAEPVEELDINSLPNWWGR